MSIRKEQCLWGKGDVYGEWVLSMGNQRFFNGLIVTLLEPKYLIDSRVVVCVSFYGILVAVNRHPSPSSTIDVNTVSRGVLPYLNMVQRSPGF